MPEPENVENSLFQLLRSKGSDKLGMPEKEIGKAVNSIRDWLKHDQKNEHIKDIDQSEAVFMILRAHTKFTACYGDHAETDRMKDFEDHIRTYFPEILAA